MQPITIVVADQERARRRTCVGLLHAEEGVTVVGEAYHGLTAIAITVRLKPRILLLDLSLGQGHGVAVLPIIRHKSPRTKVILLTGRASQAQLLDALAHGALGYLETNALRTYLAKAVRMVDAGEAWVPRKMVAKIAERLAHLTFRAEGRQGAVRPKSKAPWSNSHGLAQPS